MQISSKILETAVEQLSSLPGIGRRTALRLALHLLQRNELEIHDFAQAIIDLKLKVLHCNTCGNLADQKTCEICLNPNRNSKIVCVVEDIRDIIAIEATGAFKGKYHVLGGVISPMDGIGPNELNIEPLIIRVKNKEIDEIIFALSPTMEGDTTNFYLFKKLKDYTTLITTLSRGVSVGAELHYADELSLGRSISQRQKYDQ
ncbi:MAG: recombination mediator RecR [Crocinitomicaceae bacterium]|nr:recombination mediator RecR [Crocinitomicaceae bacterium]MDG2505111.1 recombination mediator RecR [Crocinitomicaceae bacterium]